MKDILLHTWWPAGHFEREARVCYNVMKRTAKVQIAGGDKREIVEETHQKFEDDIEFVKKLALEKIEEFKRMCTNNKVVMQYSKNEPMEMEKAQRHLRENLEAIEYLQNFLT